MPVPEIRIAVGAPFVNDRARPLTLTELQTIATAIIHFGDQLPATTQRFSRRRIWQDNAKVKRKTEIEIAGMIQDTKNAKQLTDLLNPLKGGPWTWEFSKPDCVVYVVEETVTSARQAVEKVTAIVEFISACLLVTGPAELMAYRGNRSGYNHFLTAMEERYREPRMDDSRFCQPSMEGLSARTQQDAPAPARRGIASRAMGLAKGNWTRGR